MKKKISVLCLCALMLLLAACGGQTNSAAEGTETHIYREVTENLTVDAEIIRYTGEGVPVTYDADTYNFSPENVKPFFEAIHAGEPVSTDGNLGIDFWDFADESGAYYTYREDHTLTTVFWYSRNDAAMEKETAYPVYDGEEYLVQSPLSYYPEPFVEPVDMPFATAEEAEQEVRALLSTLGFDDLILHRTLYREHTRMEQLENELKNDEIYGPYLHFYDDWTEADDAYQFEFFFPVGDSYLDYNTKVVNEIRHYGSYVLAVYDANGLVYLRVYSPMTILEAQEAPESILPAEYALNAVTELYENRISYDKRTIEKVEFAYVKEQTVTGWLLRPAWVVTVRTESENFPYLSKDTTIIDAVSGNQL